MKINIPIKPLRGNRKYERGEGGGRSIRASASQGL
jgi:hypothetical protein